MNAFQQNKGIIIFCALASIVPIVSIGHGFTSTTTKQVAAKQVTAKAKPTESIIACELKLERTLRDPDSVRYDSDLTQYVYEGGLHKVALVYNAKNGFGGYAGQSLYNCTFK